MRRSRREMGCGHDDGLHAGGVARGQSIAEIAGELLISLATVKTHVARLRLELGVRDRVQLRVAAYRSGFMAS